MNIRLVDLDKDLEQINSWYVARNLPVPTKEGKGRPIDGAKRVRSVTATR